VDEHAYQEKQRETQLDDCSNGVSRIIASASCFAGHGPMKSVKNEASRNSRKEQGGLVCGLGGLALDIGKWDLPVSNAAATGREA